MNILFRLSINSVYVHAIENRIERSFKQFERVSIGHFGWICFHVPISHIDSGIVLAFVSGWVSFIPSGTIKMFAVAHFICAVQ